MCPVKLEVVSSPQVVEDIPECGARETSKYFETAFAQNGKGISPNSAEK